MEPEHIKAILATQFQDFGKGDLHFHACKAFLGTGVFNSDGRISNIVLFLNFSLQLKAKAGSGLTPITPDSIPNKVSQSP